MRSASSIEAAALQEDESPGAVERYTQSRRGEGAPSLSTQTDLGGLFAQRLLCARRVAAAAVMAGSRGSLCLVRELCGPPSWLLPSPWTVCGEGRQLANTPFWALPSNRSGVYSMHMGQSLRSLSPPLVTVSPHEAGGERRRSRSFVGGGTMCCHPVLTRARVLCARVCHEKCNGPPRPPKCKE